MASWAGQHGIGMRWAVWAGRKVNMRLNGDSWVGTEWVEETDCGSLGALGGKKRVWAG